MTKVFQGRLKLNIIIIPQVSDVIVENSMIGEWSLYICIPSCQEGSNRKLQEMKYSSNAFSDHGHKIKEDAESWKVHIFLLMISLHMQQYNMVFRNDTI